MKKLLLIFMILPLSIFGQTQIGNEILGENLGDHSGYSTDISDDGTIVAISAYRNDENGLDSGHVRIYQYNGSNWIQLGSDIDGEAIDDYSGIEISLSADGTIIAIGSYRNDGNGTNSGHVRVYQYNGSNWSQLGADINGEVSNDASGRSVGLSSDGTIVAIGAYGNDDNGTNSGHVRVYQYNGGDWIQLGADINGEAPSDNSGYKISLSNDGSTVAVGAYGNDDNGANSGHVRVYQYNDSNWIQLGADIDGEVQDDNSGRSVSLSNDGTIVAIGAPGNDENGTDSGHVKVYQYNGSNWTQLGSDINGEASGDGSGRSLSISSDGTIIAIGASLNDGNGISSGHIRVYKYNNGNWFQIGVDIDGASTGDKVGAGSSVSLSANGSVVVAGAFNNDGNGEDSGHVRIYDLTTVLSVENQAFSNFRLYPNPTKTQFTIELKNDIELVNVTIYNNLGQLVLSSKNSTINTATFSTGTYVIKIETKQGRALKKLIIQ